MSENQETAPGNTGKIVSINEAEIATLLDRKVRESVEETINGLLDAEADALCHAGRYERSAERTDTRAGHYTRKLHTKSGEVDVKVPKLRNATFETKIIERYRRRESSVKSKETQSVEKPICPASGSPPSGCKRIQHFRTGVFEISHIPRHHREAVSFCCGRKLAVDRE